MTIDLQNISLQSMDGILVAKNNSGHLVYPMLHLDRHPTPEDAQGFQKVLIFVDAENTIRISTQHIILSEENGFYDEFEILGEGGWSIVGIDEHFLKVSSGLAGINDAMIVLEKADTLTERGTYTQYFDVVLADHYGRKMTVRVDIIVNIPLMVKTQGLHDGKGNTETLEITLGNNNHYQLEIIRDRHWHLEDVEENMISMSAMEGDGSEKPNFISPLVLTKAATFLTSAMTTFQVVSVHQRVNVVVTIDAVEITRNWIDPPAGEEGASGTGNIYVYLSDVQQDRADQLLATFYYETSHHETLPQVRVEQQSQWGSSWEQASGLRADIMAVTSDQQYRYKIDVYRTWNTSSGGYYNLQTAGTYHRRLRVRYPGEWNWVDWTQPTESDLLSPRSMYLTIQPNVQVYREIAGSDEKIYLVNTTETVVASNPLVKDVQISVANDSTTLANRNIPLDLSNDYKQTVFMQSNLPVDVYSEALARENTGNTWLLLGKNFRMTRNNREFDSRWSGTPVLTDAQNKKHAQFITSITGSNHANILVELGIEKPQIALPLLAETDLELLGQSVSRYTGSGDTIEMTAPIILPLTATLKTPHTLTITPSSITLNEENNYTAFIVVETNDEAHWSFPNVDSKITVSPTTGTGRTAVIIKKSASFNLTGNFENITLNVLSTVGNSTLSSSLNVYLERYTPLRNALIPKMESNTHTSTTGMTTIAYHQNSTEALTVEQTAAVWKSFGHVFSRSGIAGRIVNSGTMIANVLSNLNQYPAIELTLDRPHRIRSWTLQSVGQDVYDTTIGRLATVLLLQGEKLDGTWAILDIARTPSNFYNNSTKTRIDKVVDHKELVRKIRLSAIAATHSIPNRWQAPLAGLPQIQIFAGEPLMPVMTSRDRTVDDKTFRIRASNTDGAVRVFDREVNSPDIASLDMRGWYLNNGDFLQNDVAVDGEIRRFGSAGTKAWLSVIFPRTRLLGYLYSIDNLDGRSDTHAMVPYAASLYFEGRAISDIDTSSAVSSFWEEDFGIISLDNCFGCRNFDRDTAWLVSQASQTMLNTYTQNLSQMLQLPIATGIFLLNLFDRHMIRHDGTRWIDEGLRLVPGTISTQSNQFANRTTDELLDEPGQARLNAVALSRGANMEPSWTTIPDRASIVNQKDARRVMYSTITQKWSEVENIDAIRRVHDRTHYADLKDSLGNFIALEQVRFTVQSIMNTETPFEDNAVAMPELQFFSEPTETINTGTIATISYLKAEDRDETLHDILGRHVSLPHRQLWYDNWNTWTRFRFYIGTIENIHSSDRQLYLAIHNTSGQIVRGNAGIDSNSNPYLEISLSGNHTTSPVYFEVYINSSSNEKIILSSGYTGGQS